MSLISNFILGRGSFGTVYKVDNTAVKTIEYENENHHTFTSVMREVTYTRFLSHPHIINILNFTYDSNNMYITYPLALGTLKEIKIENYEDKVTICSQLAQAIAFAHSNKIMHRDVKPENILVFSQREIKLGDFGSTSSQYMSFEGEMTGDVVTLYYRSPELLLGDKKHKYGPDIWSYGCVVYYIFTGKLLFQGDSQIDQLYRIFRVLGTPNVSQWPEVINMPEWQDVFPKWTKRDDFQFTNDKIVNNLLENIFIYNPDKRYNMLQIVHHKLFIDEKLMVEISDKSCEELLFEIAPRNINVNSKDYQIAIECIIKQVKLKHSERALACYIIQTIQKYDYNTISNAMSCAKLFISGGDSMICYSMGVMNIFHKIDSIHIPTVISFLNIYLDGQNISEYSNIYDKALNSYLENNKNYPWIIAREIINSK